MLLDLATGNARKICEGFYSHTPSHLSWTPDGRALLSNHGGNRKALGRNLTLIPIDGSAPKQVDLGLGSKSSIDNLVVHPNGKTIAWTLSRTDRIHWAVENLRVDGNVVAGLQRGVKGSDSSDRSDRSDGSDTAGKFGRSGSAGRPGGSDTSDTSDRFLRVDLCRWGGEDECVGALDGALPMIDGGVVDAGIGGGGGLGGYRGDVAEPCLAGVREVRCAHDGHLAAIIRRTGVGFGLHAR